MKLPDLYYEISQELNVPNEHVVIKDDYKNLAFFHINGERSYTCKLTKTGHLKKNSIRVDNDVN